MDKQKGVITVIIPVYNTGDCIEKCLNSIFNNTYKNIEVICVDDGSTDNSNDILTNIALRESRLRIITQSNKGAASARNTALAEVNGEFVTFVDSDDWIHPKYFEFLMRCQQEHDANVVSCELKEVREQRDYPEVFYDESHVRRLNIEQFMSESHVRTHAAAHLYKSDLLVGHTFPNNMRIGEDTAFNTEVVCSAEELRLYAVTDVLYYYFMREDSAVHTVSHSEIIKLGEWYLENAEYVKTGGAKKLYLSKAFGSIFAYRYLEMFSADYRKKKSKSNSLLSTAIKKMKETDGFSAAEKIKYIALSKVPVLYRLIRIMGDRTMLQWEKSERAKRKMTQ